MIQKSVTFNIKENCIQTNHVTMHKRERFDSIKQNNKIFE